VFRKPFGKRVGLLETAPFLHHEILRAPSRIGKQLTLQPRAAR
jgi:hypothetical protein